MNIPLFSYTYLHNYHFTSTLNLSRLPLKMMFPSLRLPRPLILTLTIKQMFPKVIQLRLVEAGWQLQIPRVFQVIQSRAHTRNYGVRLYTLAYDFLQRLKSSFEFVDNGRQYETKTPLSKEYIQIFTFPYQDKIPLHAETTSVNHPTKLDPSYVVEYCKAGTCMRNNTT
jgi:hypothetical protein